MASALNRQAATAGCDSCGATWCCLPGFTY